MYIEKTYKVGELDVKLSTGKLANLAAGSVLLEIGGTSVFATVTVDKADAVQDFFPLSVEYIEKMYARGAINGSRFNKREGHPSDEAVIKARQVDHSIRSLFPKGFKKAVTVILTVLSYDEINDPEVLAVFGASTALMLSGVPYFGPSSSVVTCVDENGAIITNPEANDREKFAAEFLLSGTDEKFLNIEGWAKEVGEDKMAEVLDASLKVIKEMNDAQRDFVKAVFDQNGKPALNIEIDDSKNIELAAPEELINMIKENHYDEVKAAIFVKKDKDTNRNDNLQIIKDKVAAETMEDGKAKYISMDISNAVEYVARKALREGIMKEGKRVTDRGLDEIRPLAAEIDLLKTVHGSALFERGLTQSLSIVTLGSESMEQTIDEMEGESTKRFMHHYNMPGFSTGEASRYNYKPGRREIGHGAIGENALKNMIPEKDEFPYTIRVVSEIMTSNGSTSMAATCASSMALMAAGVPMKAAVAGIGVGLITEDGNEDNYKLILDIEGIEDFYGDMDFKITGTKNGITAIQYENKLRGVKPAVLKEAFGLAKFGRMKVLEVMNSAISAPRQELSPNAPMIDHLTIKEDQIGELIGPSGRNIKELVQKAKENFDNKNIDIKVDQDGTVMITASNKAQLDYVKAAVHGMFEEATVGQLYEGVVDKIMPYGIFVNVSPNITGLCHVSEITDVRNPDLTKVFENGDIVKVKVLKLEEGRVSFTMKGVDQSDRITKQIAGAVADTAPALPPRRDNNRGDSRFGQRRRF
jgi:polyribonucleotide nucleotidyltransferase